MWKVIYISLDNNINVVMAMPKKKSWSIDLNNPDSLNDLIKTLNEMLKSNPEYLNALKDMIKENPDTINNIMNELRYLFAADSGNDLDSGLPELKIKVEIKNHDDIDQKSNKHTTFNQSKVVFNNTESSIPDYSKEIPLDPYNSLYSNNEPIFDVLSKSNGVSIVADMKNVDSSDINIYVDGSEISFDINTEKIKFHKDISLPFLISPEKIISTYKNGILEMEIMENERKRPTKAQIKIG